MLTIEQSTKLLHWGTFVWIIAMVLFVAGSLYIIIDSERTRIRSERASKSYKHLEKGKAR